MKTNENILDFAESEDICQCGNLTPEFVTKLINEYEEKLRCIPVDKLVNTTIPFLGKDENGKIELNKIKKPFIINFTKVKTMKELLLLMNEFNLFVFNNHPKYDYLKEKYS